MASIAEALAIALEDHQHGRLQRAAQIYRQILSADPHHADALHLLGVLTHQEGDLPEAEALISKAIETSQQNQQEIPEFYNSLGNLYLDQSDETHTQKAITLFQQAIALNPQHPEFLINLGVAYYQAKQYPQAQQTLTQAHTLAPNLPEPLTNLGNVHQDLGEQDKAEAYYRQAIALDSHCADSWFNLGNLYRFQLLNTPLSETAQRESLSQQAEESYHHALMANPDNLSAAINLGVIYNQQQRYNETLRLYTPFLVQTEGRPVELWANIANAYRGLNDLDKAFQCYEKALSLKPDYEEGWYNLGNCYRQENRLHDALQAYQTALNHRDNEYAEVHVAMGTVLFLQERLSEAIHHFQTGLAQNPNLLEAYDLLGLCLNRLNRAEEAIQVFQQAYAIHPHPRYLIKAAIATPCIYASEENRLQWRKRTVEAVSQIAIQHPEPILLDNPVLDIGNTNFYQAYHGENERDFQAQYAQLYQHLPRYDMTQAPQNKKIRIGFISRLLRSLHTIGELNQGFIDHLDRSKFEVVLIHIEDNATRQDPIRIQAGDTQVWIPEADLSEASRLVLAQHLDALFYTDIGMDPTTYFLAMSRLAPVQFATWGHPVTSGIDTLDYFLSWKQAEVPEAQSHYTEKLVLLDHYTSYFYRPTLPQNPKTRTGFGFKEDSHLYLCSQTLFKVQPDFDLILAEILRRDPKAEMGFIHLRYPELGEALRARWERTMPDVVERIRFVPRMSNDDFTVFQTLADVLLDPTHFVGGTTSLEAFAFGIPIVTLPTPYLKARWTVAFYEAMDIPDCVAKSPEDYVDIALKIGTQPEYREALRQNILSKVDMLLENPAIISEFEDFVAEAVQTARHASHYPNTPTQEGSP